MLNALIFPLFKVRTLLSFFVYTSIEIRVFLFGKNTLSQQTCLLRE